MQRYLRSTCRSPVRQDAVIQDEMLNHGLAFPCRVNVPDETGKMSRSDKRGATLPKVVAA